MLTYTPSQRRQFERMKPDQLARYQVERLNRLLEKILPQNEFYAEKLADHLQPLESLDDLAELPFTFKNELVADGNDASHATNLTFPTEDYVHYHRTSGTRGRPLVVLDTADDWQWWIDTWQYVFDAAQVETTDRVMMAFSFGPFIGFWSAHDAAQARKALVIPGGGLSTLARLDLLKTAQATAICCTPTYALRMAEVAAENQVDVGKLDVRRIIVAGEPGGSVPSIRQRIERTWNAKVIDHAGASEVGPWGYQDDQRRGLRIIESEFIAEFLSVESGEPAGEGELSELVLTTLGRTGSPVIRYRTGDLVRPVRKTETENRFVLLEGGVLGRADDMMIIRGVNVFPSAIEQILRSFPEIIEYRLTAVRAGEMDDLRVEIEDRLNDADRVAKELNLRLGLRVEVRCVDAGSLPRFEAKGKRFIDQRE